MVGARTPGLAARLVICEANLDPLPITADGERFSQRIAAQGEEGFVSTGYAAILAAVPAWRPTLRLAAPWAVFRSARELLAGTRPTMRELFSSLRIPRTFIAGELGEPLLGTAALQDSGVRVATIPAAGHVMMLDAPEAFLHELATALAEPGPA